MDCRTPLCALKSSAVPLICNFDIFLSIILKKKIVLFSMNGASNKEFNNFEPPVSMANRGNEQKTLHCVSESNIAIFGVKKRHV